MDKENISMKKIITLSYYADFSRFFNCTFSFAEKNKIDHIDLCVNFSAKAYNILNNVKSVYLPSAVKNYNANKLDFDISSDIYDDVEVYYLENTPSWYSTKKKQYLNYFYDLFLQEKPDLVIVSGDSRVAANCCSVIAKVLGLKLLHMEQGPINTTILDPIGVNANCSFRSNNYTSKDDRYLRSKKNERVAKWNNYKWYRVLDLLSTPITSLFYKEVENNWSGFIKKNDIKQSLNTCSNLTNKKILLILQVPHDVNMKVHSPYFSNHTDIVRAVRDAIPDEYTLIVREHPLFKGQYDEELYFLVESSHNVIISNNDRLDDAINSSELTIVNNSTVGLEALFLNSPLVVLGNSYYDNPKFVYKYNGNGLDKLILKAISEPIDNLVVTERLNYLFNEHFIDGHFRDLDTKRFKSIWRVIDELLI